MLFLEKAGGGIVDRCKWWHKKGNKISNMTIVIDKVEVAGR